MDGLIALALAKKAANSGTKTVEGAGAPGSMVVAKKGDLYLDTTNNQVYMCTHYVDPNNIDDLTNLTIVLKDKIEILSMMDTSGSSAQSSKKDYYINFQLTSTSENKTYIRFQYTNANSYIMQYWNSSGNGVNVWNNSTTSWGVNTLKFKSFKITGGSAVGNSTLIDWFVRNAADISGVGSTWIALDSELPVVSSVDNGKVLGVDNGGWAKIDAPSGLPTISAGDSGKVLTVNAGETGAEWSTPASSGVQYFSGSGEPLSSIVARPGDLYRDTVTNYLYQCTSYIDPIAVTDLTGAIVTFDSDLGTDPSMVSTGKTYSINFTTEEPASYTSLSMYGQNQGMITQIAYGGAQTGSAYYYANNPKWTVGKNPITITGGTDATNSELITFIGNHGTIPNTGSSWVRIECEDELPTISAADEGKVLTVNGVGGWTVSEIANTGVSYYEGSSNPVSSIACKKGDLYRNTTSGDMYVCTTYNDPNNITDLTGLTFYFKDAGQVNFKNLMVSGSTSTNGLTKITFVCDGVNYKGIFKDLGMNTSYYRDTNDTNTAAYNFSGVPQWYDTKFRTISVTGGDDSTNSNNISVFISSADDIQGTGSQWAKVMPDELPSTTSSDEGKLLQVNSSGSWNKSNAFEEETWTFTLTDNTTITRTVLVKVVE